MRVPLPGRDYFPPRVLLRGATRPVLEPRPEPRGVLIALRPWPGTVPASPPAPSIGLRPEAA